MAAARWHTFQILTKRPERMREIAERLEVLSNVCLGTSVESADLTGIHWAIVGGESGPGARPPKIEWVRAIRDRCEEQEVAFFFKQWGGTRRKHTGRELDGRTWNGKPQV